MSKTINSPRQLKEAGVSPWYDNIERRIILNGVLKSLFDSGVLGVTTNPTIFEKAIISSTDYDQQIISLIREGQDSRSIYDELTIKDVRDAADLLRGVYESSGYIDGYVSIEVSPEYAQDSLKTTESGRSIFKKIGRPNIMIKVPGTDESSQAIRTLIREGINVNVTLLFFPEHYKSAAMSYIAGLKDRLSQGKPLNSVNSVASVFVSRIDTAVDKMLDGLGKLKAGKELEPEISSLRGLAAIANSKMVYLCFKELFYNRDFNLLKAKGANIQRPLWASTGTKNPAYSDIKYVEGLIAKDSVITMPQATLEAYLDHGRVGITLEKEAEESKTVLTRLSSLGIDISQVCLTLQEEGVSSFVSSFHKVISSLEAKLEQVSNNGNSSAVKSSRQKY